MKSKEDQLTEERQTDRHAQSKMLSLLEAHKISRKLTPDLITVTQQIFTETNFGVCTGPTYLQIFIFTNFQFLY